MGEQNPEGLQRVDEVNPKKRGEKAPLRKEKKLMYTFQLFSSGNLMRGQFLHYLCADAVKIEEAVVCGSLYQDVSGCAALMIPRESRLWRGSKYIYDDAEEQHIRNNDKNLKFKIYEGWNVVHGELITFFNPKYNIPKIDDVLWRYPIRDRVLVPVTREDGSVATAWIYPTMERPFGSVILSKGIWPTNRKVKEIKINKSGADTHAE